jgi:hypothetical protein
MVQTLDRHLLNRDIATLRADSATAPKQLPAVSRKTRLARRSAT